MVRTYLKPDFIKYKEYVQATYEELWEEQFGTENKVDKLTLDNLKEYTCKIISKRNVKHELFKVKNSLDFNTDLKVKIFDRVLSDLNNILCEPENYLADMISMIYMTNLYYMKELDLFYNRATICDKNAEKAMEKLREEIRSIWCRDNKGNLTDKSKIREMYPITITMKIEDDEKHIKSIPGGCWDFHRVMISKENINLFDVQNDSESFQKYSFPKMYAIQRELQATPIENKLLMEYSLGIGYINETYTHVRRLQTLKELDVVCDFIKEGAAISQFFMRKKIMNILWKAIRLDILDEKDLNNAIKLLRIVKEVLNDIYESVLELWWCAIVSDYFVIDMYQWQLQMAECWKKYYDHSVIYQDWIQYRQIHDWEKIYRVEDCFRRCESNLDVWMYGSRMTLEDAVGERRSLDIDLPINQIGETVLELSMQRMQKMLLPLNKKELECLYFKIREECFNELQIEENVKFFEADLKIGKKQKRIKSQHIYAYVAKNVVRTLLRNVKS